jgi:hypothetical protein
MKDSHDYILIGIVTVFIIAIIVFFIHTLYLVHDMLPMIIVGSILLYLGLYYLGKTVEFVLEKFQ